MDFFSKKKGPEIPASARIQESGSSQLAPLRRIRRGLGQFNSALPYVFVAAIGAMMADLTGVAMRAHMIPNAAPNAKPKTVEPPPYRPLSDYNDILARNVFNSDGIIPDIEIAENSPDVDNTSMAKESQLPLTLVGTIVHVNPGKCVATIEAKGNAEKILPYIPNDDIEGLATLIKVERKKAFIRNLSSGALEFIHIKDDSAFSFQKKMVPKDPAMGPFQKEGDGVFAINRSELEGLMSNLPQLLTEARALPNMVNGRIDGFRVVDIQENSILRKLVDPGDVIKQVDGEQLDSVSKSMELYNSLRTKNQVRLVVERNGRLVTLTYNIR